MTIKLKPLAEQAVVVTGASSGIGLATARSFAAAGARVLLVARSEDALAEEVASIAAAGGEAHLHVADVGDPAAMRAAAARAAEWFGGIDTWVNNAGTTIYASLEGTPDDEHERLFRTDYFGVVHGCRAALPYLKASGGALVTVASIASDMPAPRLGAYSAAKHAVKAYVEVLRMELAHEGAPVSVTLVKPSGIDTPIGQHAVNHEGGEAQIPPPTYHPQLVADAILHAATHAVREVTVGGAGRLQVLAYQHVKGAMQRLAPWAAKAFVDPTKEQPDLANLWHGAGDRRVRSGEASPRRTSLYTTAALHPLATSAALAGAGALAAWLVARRRGAEVGEGAAHRDDVFPAEQRDPGQARAADVK